jgi:hypothetical protein
LWEKNEDFCSFEKISELEWGEKILVMKNKFTKLSSDAENAKIEIEFKLKWKCDGEHKVRWNRLFS